MEAVLNNNSMITMFVNSEFDNHSQIPNNKKAGVKSEVYPFEIEDMRKILAYYEEREMWLHQMLFTLSINIARRISDMLSLKWFNFFDPKTGDFRSDIYEIKEKKTDKIANPHINSAVRAAIKKYIANANCSVSDDNYSGFVFMQRSGNYAGRVLSESSALKVLKKAAQEVGIKYNVGTHSMRKTFGMMTRRIHPSDNDSMELLQTIYNHSDTKVTNRYIGLTKQKIDAYYDDMGNFFDDYVTGNKQLNTEKLESPVISLDVNDLRELIKRAYEAGINNINSKEISTHIDSVNDIMRFAETLMK